MGKIIDSLKELWCKWRGEAPCDTDVGELRALFRARYHNFKLLLNANNTALEIMAGLEAALRTSRSASRTGIFASISTPSREMIRALDRLLATPPR